MIILIYLGHSPFMMNVVNAKDKAKVPSVVHVDNTCRVQRVY